MVYKESLLLAVTEWQRDVLQPLVVIVLAVAVGVWFIANKAKLASRRLLAIKQLTQQYPKMKWRVFDKSRIATAELRLPRFRLIASMARHLDSCAEMEIAGQSGYIFFMVTGFVDGLSCVAINSVKTYPSMLALARSLQCDILSMSLEAKGQEVKGLHIASGWSIYSNDSNKARAIVNETVSQVLANSSHIVAIETLGNWILFVGRGMEEQDSFASVLADVIKCLPRN